MRDTQLFQLALGINSPWFVAASEFDAEKKKLDLCVEWKEYIKPMTPTHDLKAIVKVFEAQYPLIPHIDRWDYSSSKVAKAMVDYANMIDG